MPEFICSIRYTGPLVAHITRTHSTHDSSAAGSKTPLPLSIFLNDITLSSFFPSLPSCLPGLCLFVYFPFAIHRASIIFQNLAWKEEKTFFLLTYTSPGQKNFKSPSTYQSESNFDTCFPTTPVITPTPCESCNFNKKQVTRQTSVLPEHANTHAYSVTNNS